MWNLQTGWWWNIMVDIQTISKFASSPLLTECTQCMLPSILKITCWFSLSNVSMRISDEKRLSGIPNIVSKLMSSCTNHKVASKRAHLTLLSCHLFQLEVAVCSRICSLLLLKSVPASSHKVHSSPLCTINTVVSVIKACSYKQSIYRNPCS